MNGMKDITTISIPPFPDNLTIKSYQVIICSSIKAPQPNQSFQPPLPPLPRPLLPLLPPPPLHPLKHTPFLHLARKVINRTLLTPSPLKSDFLSSLPPTRCPFGSRVRGDTVLVRATAATALGEGHCRCGAAE